MSTTTRTSLQFSQDVMNYINDTIYPTVVDAILRSNVLFQVLMSKQGRFTGKNKVINVKTSKLGTGGSFSGFDTFNTNSTNTTVQMVFEPRFFEQPVVLAGTDLSVANTKAAVIDFVTMKFEEAAQEAADSIGTMLYGDGTTNTNKDFLGLAAAIKNSITTYGGLTKSSYVDTNADRTVFGSPSLIGGNEDSTTTLATLTLAKLDTMYRACTSGLYRPNLIVTTKAIYAKIESLYQPITNFTTLTNTSDILKGTADDNGLKAQYGYTSLTYKGIPVLVDEKCPASTLYMLNLDTIEFATLPMANTSPIGVASSVIEGQYDENFSGFSGFSRSEQLQPYNQYGFITHIFLGGNLIVKNPKYNGVMDALA